MKASSQKRGLTISCLRARRFLTCLARTGPVAGLAAVVVAVLLVAACSSGATSDSTTSTADGSLISNPTGGPTTAPSTTVDPGPTRGGNATILLANDPTPFTGWSPWDDVCAWACRNVLDHVLETLAVVLPDGTVQPWLAQSIDPDVSLKLWTVELRTGINFSDGQAMTAAVIKDGIDSYLKSGDASRGHVRDARLLAVQALDDETLIFELSEPVGGFAASLAGPLGRVFSVAAVEADEDRFAVAPVGTGPFKFQSWSPGQPVVLSANSDYWMADPEGESLPYLSQLTFVQVPDESDRLAQLLAGDAEVMQTRVPQTISEASEASESRADSLTVVSHIDDNVGAIVFNTLESPFDDVRVRRGLALAVDQEQLLDVIDTDVLLATQWWAPSSVWYSQLAADQWPTNDLTAAAELLNDYIADPERSDERASGEPVQVRIQCTDDVALVTLLDELALQLDAIGLVEVIAETVTRTGLIQRVTGSVADSPSFSGDFTATCWRLGGESDPWVLLEAALGPIRTSPLNIANLYTEDLAALADLLQGTYQPAARRSIIEKIMQVFASEVPYLYLGHSQSAVIARSEVRGIEEWSLPSGEVVQGHRLGVGRYTELWVPSG